MEVCPHMTTIKHSPITTYHVVNCDTKLCIFMCQLHYSSHRMRIASVMRQVVLIVLGKEIPYMKGKIVNLRISFIK